MDQKWAILVLIHAEDAKTKHFSNIFLNELLQTNDAAHLKIFILRNTYSYSISKSMDAVLSELVFDAGENEKKLNFIKDYGKINLGDSKQLSKIFDEVLMRTGKDYRFIVITWDHGFSFGIFNGEIGANKVFSFEKNDTKSHVVITNIAGGVRALGAGNDKPENIIDAVIEECTSAEKLTEDFIDFDRTVFKDFIASSTTDMLTPEEIATAIDASFAKKIDILIMMNCWMQSIDTCYALEKSVDILVAATSTMDFIGYDYIDFINKICSNPEVTPSDLSNRIISKIEGKYIKLKTEIAFKEIAASAINLSSIKKLKAVIDIISTSLDVVIKNNLVAVNKERIDSYEVTHEYLPTAGIFFYYVVDMSDVMTRLLSRHFISQKDVEKLNNWFSDFLIKNTIGDNFTNETQALGIYFPNNKEYVMQSTYYYEFYSPTGPKKNHKRFALESSWSAFIDKYNKGL